MQFHLWIGETVFLSHIIINRIADDQAMLYFGNFSSKVKQNSDI